MHSTVSPDLDIDLQIGNDVSHVVAQMPQGQAARVQGQVPGTPCLPPHHGPAALQVHLDALQPKQVLEHNIVLGHDLHLQS